MVLLKPKTVSKKILMTSIIITKVEKMRFLPSMGQMSFSDAKNYIINSDYRTCLSTSRAENTIKGKSDPFKAQNNN